MNIFTKQPDQSIELAKNTGQPLLDKDEAEPTLL